MISNCKLHDSVQQTTLSLILFTGILEDKSSSKNLKMPAENIQYSEKYCDEHFEYRHVILPPELAKLVPRAHLMTETEWRNLGEYNLINRRNPRYI